MTPSLPAVQRAWICVARGKPATALRFETAYPVPTKVPRGSVLIRVQAAALNPVGYKLMAMTPFATVRSTIAEYELSGIVVDANGSEFTEGDAVVAHIEAPVAIKTKQGALAEYVLAPASAIVKRPVNITPTQAAGVPLAGQTAWQALFNIGGLEAGQTVFINGGSTAVGSFAIQWAKARGCTVVASASGKNEKYVRDLGADDFVDYTKQDLATRLSTNPPAVKYNLFFETVGLSDNSLYLNSEKYLAPGGRFVSVGPPPSWKLFRLLLELVRPVWLGGVKRPWRMIAVRPSKKDLQEIFGLLEAGNARPLVDSVYTMEDTLKAYDRLLTGRATGKVVVRVDPDAE